MPWYPDEEEPGHEYTVETSAEKLVADYARVTLADVEEMDYIGYRVLLRDAFVSKLNATESGREYLRKAWLLSRTDNDREKSRAVFGNG